jgi:hypothetical protein
MFINVEFLNGWFWVKMVRYTILTITIRQVIGSNYDREIFMMTDVQIILPNLPGRYVHAVQTEANPLAESLAKIGFEVYSVQGARIVNESTFFEEIARSLRFPDHCGHSWGAFDECINDIFTDFLEDPERHKIAIIWEDADITFAADATTFLKCVETMRSFILYTTRDDPRESQHLINKRYELFLIVRNQGFSGLNYQSLCTLRTE